MAEKANLNGGYIMEGTEIVFNWNAYSLCVRINDTTPRCLVVTELGRALFDVYVGEKPISSSAWASFVKGAKELYC